jgi:hypothetical protein
MNRSDMAGRARALPFEIRRVSLSRFLRSRVVAFGLLWTLGAMLVASLEVAIDPLMAWEHQLEMLFGLLFPAMALVQTFGICRRLASPQHPKALAARHGADRRRTLVSALAVSLSMAMALSCAALWLSRILCHSATEPLLNRDLLLCCGIGCLATGAYIGFFLAATRLGMGVFGAWMALGVDLTLGHINGGLSMILPHRHVVNLIGHPSVLALSARASSWILLGFAVAGIAFTLARTPS